MIPFQILTEEEIQQIHKVSVRVLETVGVRISHAEALGRFKAAGAEVNESSQIVKIPEKLIMESLTKAGKQFCLYGRDRNNQARFGYGERNYNSIAGEAHWVEDSITKRRPANLGDVAVAARVGHALSHINIVGAMSDPQEMSPAYRSVAVAAELLRNTTKPIVFWFNNRLSAKYILEVFTVVAGSEEEASAHPFSYPILEPISPLRFPYEGVDLLFETCRFPLPVQIAPMAQVGATAPGTLIGTVVQENAEILAGAVLVQLIRPGTPLSYGGIPHAFDMKTTQMIFAGPEQALMAVALTQMAKHYGLSAYINVGLTDSKIPDAQAGLEAGITLALGALAGADEFGHMGICGVDQATSLDMLILQHEIIAYVERLMQGMTVNNDTLALEVITSTAGKKSYLAHPHTVSHFREELWFPELLDRDFFESWARKGTKDMRDRCIERRNDLLNSPAAEPLDPAAEREIQVILKSAEYDLNT